jgi:cobalt-zinc-cadmium efflux system protein
MTAAKSHTASPRLPAERSQQVVLALTSIYFFIELAGGIHFHSLALVTDASFMAINIAGQVLAVYAGRIALRQADRSKTFGYERAKVLSGLFTGILVGFLIFYVLIEAYRKILHPEPIDADKVLFIAVLGLVVNAYGLFRLNKQADRIHIKGALLLVLSDTLGSVGVIASSVIIRFTGLYVMDPLAGAVISLLIGYPTYHLLKDSMHILMEGNPSSARVEDVKQFIYDNFQNATSVKEIYIWGLSTERVMCAVRIRSNGLAHHREAVRSLKKLLRERFGFSDIFIEEYEASSVGQQSGRR